MAGEEVIAARGIHHAAARLARGVERFLKRRRVVGLAVTFGAEIANGVLVRIGPGDRHDSGAQQDREWRG